MLLTLKIATQIFYVYSIFSSITRAFQLCALTCVHLSKQTHELMKGLQLATPCCEKAILGKNSVLYSCNCQHQITSHCFHLQPWQSNWNKAWSFHISGLLCKAIFTANHNVPLLLFTLTLCTSPQKPVMINTSTCTTSLRATIINPCLN